jgi:tRNA pseudouridine38-40 synthase
MNSAKRTLKLTVQYDGTELVGWQRQSKGTSVQGLLEEALAAFEGEPVTVHGAGRTDAGVHALAQVASVSLTTTHGTHAIQRGLNAALPPSVRVVSVEEARPGFHARFDASGKVYEYRIVNAPWLSPFLARYAWHVPQPLDVDAMRDAAGSLVGRHDFAAFQGTRSSVRNTIRTVESIEWRVGASPPVLAGAAGPAGGDAPLVLTLTADGFLRHMVRIVVGTLVDVGMGRWPAGSVEEMLASGDRVRAGRTAPAHGLFLVRVRY